MRKLLLCNKCIQTIPCDKFCAGLLKFLLAVGHGKQLSFLPILIFRSSIKRK